MMCRFLLHHNPIVNDENMDFNGSIYGTSVHQQMPFSICRETVIRGLRYVRS